jgi:hypothetical protein
MLNYVHGMCRLNLFGPQHWPTETCHGVMRVCTSLDHTQTCPPLPTSHPPSVQVFVHDAWKHMWGTLTECKAFLTEFLSQQESSDIIYCSNKQTCGRCNYCNHTSREDNPADFTHRGPAPTPSPPSPVPTRPAGVAGPQAHLGHLFTNTHNSPLSHLTTHHTGQCVLAHPSTPTADSVKCSRAVQAPTTPPLHTHIYSMTKVDSPWLEHLPIEECVENTDVTTVHHHQDGHWYCAHMSGLCPSTCQYVANWIEQVEQVAPPDLIVRNEGWVEEEGKHVGDPCMWIIDLGDNSGILCEEAVSECVNQRKLPEQVIPCCVAQCDDVCDCLLRQTITCACDASNCLLGGASRM